MFKTLFFTLLLALSSGVQAKVEARWLTVASVALEDGSSTLLFDPMWTRATWKHWLGLSPLKSDQDLVAKILKEQGLQGVDAVFASHSHFDHAVDAPMVAKLTGATFFVDANTQKIARAYQEPKMRTQLMTEGEKIQVGAFSITPFRRRHGQIHGLFDYLPGEVADDFDFGFYDYKLGDLWFYLIEHPDGVIILDESPFSFAEKLPAGLKKVDAVIEGIANRVNDEEITEGYLSKYKPRVFMPLHFDNFFFSFGRDVYSLLPGVEKDRLMGKLKKVPGLTVIDPKYGESYEVLKTKNL